jgi:excisionase family DNA binding protein
MRKDVAERLATEAGDTLLSTGEVAAMLGVSRQHVVDLCNAGLLPFIRVGTHRRIRRADAEGVVAGSARPTRDQVRSLLLAHATAGRIVFDPTGTRLLARSNIRRMRESAARGAALIWLTEWDRLLDGPLVELLHALTSPSLRSRELRQNNPFAGVLSEQELAQVLRSVEAAGR